MKFCMQVPIVSNNIYIKSKNPPRIGGGRQPPRRGADEIATCAHCGYFEQVDWQLEAGGWRREMRDREMKCYSRLFTIVRAVALATRGSKKLIVQGCHPRRIF